MFKLHGSLPQKLPEGQFSFRELQCIKITSLRLKKKSTKQLSSESKMLFNTTFAYRDLATFMVNGTFAHSNIHFT